MTFAQVITQRAVEAVGLDVQVHDAAREVELGRGVGDPQASTEVKCAGSGVDGPGHSPAYHTGGVATLRLRQTRATTSSPPGARHGPGARERSPGQAPLKTWLNASTHQRTKM